MTGGEREDEIAVMHAPTLVDDDHAVAVAVEGEPRVGFPLHHEPLERLGCGRATAGVDVLTVGAVERRDHLGACVGEDGGRDPVGRAVRAVERDAQAIEARCHRKEEGLVVLYQAAGVADKPDPALRRPRQGVVAGHERFDLVLDRVGQLLRPLVEELDSVVGRGIV